MRRAVGAASGITNMVQSCEEHRRVHRGNQRQSFWSEYLLSALAIHPSAEGTHSSQKHMSPTLGKSETHIELHRQTTYEHRHRSILRMVQLRRFLCWTLSDVAPGHSRVECD